MHPEKLNVYTNDRKSRPRNHETSQRVLSQQKLRQHNYAQGLHRRRASARVLCEGPVPLPVQGGEQVEALGLTDNTHFSLTSAKLPWLVLENTAHWGHTQWTQQLEDPALPEATN